MMRQGVSMRVMRVTLAAILGCMMAMAWVGAPAFADGGHGGGGGGGGGHDAGRDDGGGGGGGGVQDIQVRDDCDPATFNAAIGAGASATATRPSPSSGPS